MKKTITTTVLVVFVGLVIWIYINYRQNKNDGVATNDIFVSDADLEQYEDYLEPDFKEADIVAHVRVHGIREKTSHGDTRFPGKAYISYVITADTIEVFKGKVNQTFEYELWAENSFDPNNLKGERVVFLLKDGEMPTSIENSTRLIDKKTIQALRDLK